jgi:hypothetical protein
LSKRPGHENNSSNSLACRDPCGMHHVRWPDDGGYCAPRFRSRLFRMRHRPLCTHPPWRLLAALNWRLTLPPLWWRTERKTIWSAAGWDRSIFLGGMKGVCRRCADHDLRRLCKAAPEPLCLKKLRWQGVPSDLLGFLAYSAPGSPPQSRAGELSIEAARLVEGRARFGSAVLSAIGYISFLLHCRIGVQLL